MKTSTLFIVGLIVGAVAVFGIRAAGLENATGSQPEAGTAPPLAEGNPVDPHAGHDMPAEPAQAPDPEPRESAPTNAGDRKPENEICPVMGNEVDPDVFVDYQGRRIGFCCAGCDEQFLADPEKYLKKVDAEIAARNEAK